MSTPQGGHPHDITTTRPTGASTPAATSNSSGGALAAPSSRRSWQRAVVAGSGAVAVGILILCSVGMLFVAAVRVGLDLLGLPMAVVWPAVGISGLVATAASCRLALNVWRYEIDEAENIV